ncbi:chronophin-like [Panonychus citri]|uniref:chronophin-like n=1 Tax=Panonychus citri TaxID=50023 RepID=UPI0023072E07|nr:chronophin-like [Panonychus citri]XP_053204238.1 chronophin-like [Panonychus citri]
MFVAKINLIETVTRSTFTFVHRPITRSIGSLNMVNLLNSREGVSSILNNVDTIITDCDGVIWLEKKSIPGANSFFKKMRSMGKRIIFATNNNTKSRESLLTKLNSLEFEATIDEIMVTTFAAPIALKRIDFKGKVFCLGTPILRKEIESAGFTVIPPSSDTNENVEDAKLVKMDHIDYELIKIDPQVGAVVIGMDYGLSNVKMIRACTYVSKVDSKCIICTNTDFTFPGPGGIVIPGTGSYVELIEHVTGKKMFSVGKPTTFFFECIKQIHANIDPARTLMIGDRCDTDIAFGNNNKMKFTLLVGTGVNNLDDVKQFASNGDNHLIPSHFIQSLGDLNKYLTHD